MADTNETITDIIKKMRAEADYIEETARGSLKAGENYDGIAFTESDFESALDLAETKRKEADRLEAAHRREMDALKQRCAELDAEVAAKDEVIKRLNDAIAEEQKRSGQVGNAAKLREALEMVRDAHFVREENGEDCEGFDVEADDGTGRPLICVVEDALSAPPRNCDVGTTREQEKRHKEEVCPKSACPKHEGFVSGACKGCFAMWAQMPYVEKEGGAK